MRETIVKGYRVKYEETEQPGINYLLYDLGPQEAKVFFEQAKAKKYAEFEDEHEGQYTLSYNRDGTYTLIRRKGDYP